MPEHKWLTNEETERLLGHFTGNRQQDWEIWSTLVTRLKADRREMREIIDRLANTVSLDDKRKAWRDAEDMLAATPGENEE